MADVLITTHYITSSPAPSGMPYAAGQYVRVIGDGPLIRAELWTQATGGEYISNPSGGPDLVGDIAGYVFSKGGFQDPKYCDGTDMVYYSVKDTWPYADYHVSINHPSCAIIVCDLDITGVIVTNESTAEAADGQIAITATSSNGNIRYSLNEGFTYNDGLPSPLTGLPSGNYVVHAIDEHGCRDQINVFVDVDYTYGVWYRMEYDVIEPRGYKTRIDIEKRDYTGPVNSTCGGGTPCIINYNRDEDSQLIPSEIEIELMVEDGQESKFDDIRIGDDRQHVIKKYVDRSTGVWELESVGYISSEFYEEPYYHEPYPIKITAIDGLGELKNKRFMMPSGEEYFGRVSLLYIITECLKKLPVPLQINSAINIFENRMLSSPSDDVLAQTYIKAENFRGKNCDEVITSILAPFTGAELFQANGAWWIRTREQASDSTIEYRTFDKDGIYVSSGSINAVVPIAFPSALNRAAWVDRSPILSYTRPIGKINIIHNLDKDNNMIDSGGFEMSDIDPSTRFFRDWNFFPSQTGISSGHEAVDNSESKGAIYFQFSAAGGPQKQWGVDQGDNVLMTKQMPLTLRGDTFIASSVIFKITFEAFIAPFIADVYARIGWKLRMIDSDTGDFWDWYPPANSAYGTSPHKRTYNGVHSGFSFPAGDAGSGVDGVIMAGDYWVIEADGVIGGKPVKAGDYLIAAYVSPLSDPSRWIVENPVTGGLINDLYIDEFSSFKKFELSGFRLPGTFAVRNYILQFSLHYHSHKGKDFINMPPGGTAFDRLRAFNLDLLRDSNLRIRTGKRFTLNNTPGQGPTYVYELQTNTNAEDEPQTIRPNQYNPISYPYHWVIIDEIDADQDDPFIDRILFDNVKISIYPFITNGSISGTVEPPEAVTYSKLVSKNNETETNIEVLNGDLPTITGGEYIYNGFYTLSDGTPTETWGRTSVIGDPEEVDLILNGDFDTAGGWTNEGLGVGWVLSGGVATASLTNDSTKKLTQIISNTVAGDYNLIYSVTVTGIQLGTDSLNLGFAFFDPDNNLLHSSGAFISIDGIYYPGLDNFFSVPSKVGRIEISASVNSGSGINVQLNSVQLHGPRVGSERRKLLDIYLEYLTAQDSKGIRKINGSLTADRRFYFINSLIDMRDMLKYRIHGFSFDDKNGLYTIEMHQTLVGPDGESPPYLGAYSLEAYNEGYF